MDVDSVTGEKFEQYPCSLCNGKTFETIQGWKMHMSRKHGGYDEAALCSAVESAQGKHVAERQDMNAERGEELFTFPGGREAAPTSVVGAPTISPPPPPPRVISRKTRELNEKLNDALKLCLKSITQGLDDSEKDLLASLRTDVIAAAIGVEVDFEAQTFQISSGWWLWLIIVLMIFVPQLPPLGITLSNKFKEKISQKLSEDGGKANEKGPGNEKPN